ncbi:MAG: transposase [Desulfovibrio sp.]|nr:transposase [Desulfovibrio sp.]
MTNLPPCTIEIEACGGAHTCVRTLIAIGHMVNPIKAKRVSVFPDHRNKTAAADAQAICEALMHPRTTFVIIKTVAQRLLDFLLDRRERLVHDRTEVINQTRAFLAEPDPVMPREIQHFDTHFRALISELLEEFNNRIQSVLAENFSE